MPTKKNYWKLGVALLLSAVCVLLLQAGARAQTPGEAEIQQGAQLFAENCAMCHSETGEGRIGATLNQNWPSIRPDLTVRTVIANGVEGSLMLAFGTENGGPLTGEQIDALTAYILSWETGERIIVEHPTPASPALVTAVPGVEGDSLRGASLYAENCSVCHGAEGEGRVGATLAQNWPSIRPDLTIQATIANGVDGSLMPAWSQENGGPLNDQDIQDLTAYILSWETSGNVPVVETGTQDSQPVRSWLLGIAALALGLALLGAIIAVALFIQNRGKAGR